MWSLVPLGKSLGFSSEYVICQLKSNRGTSISVSRSPVGYTRSKGRSQGALPGDSSGDPKWFSPCASHKSMAAEVHDWVRPFFAVQT